jgi:hypothetical protein
MIKAIALAGLITVFGTSFARADSKPAEPFKNPHLADSTYPLIHGRANYTPLPGPIDSSRRLKPSEIRWIPMGPGDSHVIIYSGPYPDGRRVMWVGGYDRVAKVDADSYEVLTTYAIGGTQFITESEARRRVDKLDSLPDGEFLDYVFEIWEEPFTTLPSWYRVLNSRNELFMGHRSTDGTFSIRAYAERDNSDPASPIYLAREWKLHRGSGTIFGIQMTYDGYIAFVTQDGTLTLLSQDFGEHHSIKLEPKKKGDVNSGDIFNSYVRNGLATDDRGGIYVVTRDNMNRIQWTGRALSTKAADGAWSLPYPNAQGIGSGTTPSLMGWGEQEDHLVLIADGTRGNNMMAFWRDEIPEDWQGIPGFDRRVAGVTPVDFGVQGAAPPQVENSIMVYGYGAFLDNTNPVTELPDQGNGGKQWLAESYFMHVPGHEAKGGTRISWDPERRVLETSWNNQTNFASSICSLSGGNDTVYCWGNRDREWTMEAVDWQTGESRFHYILGASHKFNVFGTPILIAPNGSIDCPCHGGMGMVRITPLLSQ